MIVFPDGKVWLDEGETIPVACRCKQVYQPPAGSETSVCPQCARVNIHAEYCVEASPPN